MKKRILSFFAVIIALFMCATAVIAAEFYTESEATVIDGKIVIHTEYSQALDNEFLSVALYEADGRMVDYFVVPALYGRDCTDIVLDDIQTVVSAKIFVMADKTGLSPLSEAETVVIDRSCEDDEIFVPEDKYTSLYRVIATPTYCFEGANDTTASLDMGEAVLLERYDDNEDATITETKMPRQFYTTLDELGLEGKADDYIMACIDLTFSIDEDGMVSEIHSAESLMVKKTVTELQLGRVTTNTMNSYYDPNYEVKRLNGKVSFDGEEAYFFNAPYSYLEPVYTPDMSDQEEYWARNRKNLKFVDICSFGLVEKEQYRIMVNSPIPMNGSDSYFIVESDMLADLLIEVMAGGKYEADLYDVDGDGIYDYIDVKPYSFYFADDDEDFEFKYDGFNNEEHIVYTNGANLEGIDFENGDLIVGYFDQMLNYIKVVDIIEPVEATINGIKQYSGKITLSTGEQICVTDGWRLFDNFDKSSFRNAGYNANGVNWEEFSRLLKASAMTEFSAMYYVYDGSLVYLEDIDHSLKTDGTNLLVLTPNQNGISIKYTVSSGVTTTYVYAFVDGELQWIVLDEEANSKIYVDDSAEWSVYDAIDEGDLLNQIVAYSVNADGEYTIMPLNNVYDKNGIYIGMSDDVINLEDEENAGIQCYMESPDGYLVKTVGSRYHLRDTADRNGTSLIPFDLLIDENTKIIIRNEYENDNGKKVLAFADVTPEALLQATIEQHLVNIQVVVQNNVEYTDRENLVFLFAEVNGVKFGLGIPETTTTTNNERIVKYIDYNLNADSQKYAVYDLLNPYTGATEYEVAGVTVGTKTYKTALAIGETVEVVNGKVNDETAGIPLKNEKIYMVVDYVAVENALKVVEMPAKSNSKTLEELVSTSTVYTLNVEDAAVSVLTGALDKENTYACGTYMAGDINKLTGSDKSYLAYNVNYEVNDDFKTVYGKYVKVVFGMEGEIEDTVDSNGYNGNVKYIIVNVHSGEDIWYCNIKK